MIQFLERKTLQADNTDLFYPESDGKPLADNTLQFEFITKIQGGIDTLLADDPNVFVAGDLFWYPVEGSLTNQAPDVMVAFGRPKGHRRSYKQWQEGDIAPQVVFEILSHSNTRKEMRSKLAFYERYGVEEYYEYDPYNNRLKGWIRSSKEVANRPLQEIIELEGWVSPRLNVRFETHSGVLELYRPDGKRFENFVEIAKRAEQEEQRAEQADRRAEQADRRAEQADRRAEQADRRAEQADRHAEQADQRAEQADRARHDAISRLLQLGLTVEQVAEALGFSVEEVANLTESSEQDLP
jgi:Uma2 family endonuclease